MEEASLDGFQADPLWIAKSLRPKITVAQARKVVVTLFRLGLLEEVEGGGVVVCDGSVSTPHEVAGLAVHNYHQGMLLRAGEAISSFAPDERHFCGVTVSIPDALELPTGAWCGFRLALWGPMQVSGTWAEGGRLEVLLLVEEVRLETSEGLATDDRSFVWELGGKIGSLP